MFLRNPGNQEKGIFLSSWFPGFLRFLFLHFTKLLRKVLQNDRDRIDHRCLSLRV